MIVGIELTVSIQNTSEVRSQWNKL